MDYNLSGSNTHGILQAVILGMGSHAFLQGIFLIQGSNSCLPEAPALQVDFLWLSL